MKNYIGIDLGTSGVKILLVDGRGKIRNEVTEEYPVFYPQSGWSEQNPEDWFEAVKRGLKKLDAKNVAGISFGGQMHGLVILDGDDKVIRPCILWNDGRTEKQTEYLNTVIGKEKLSALTANVAFAGFTAPKILWVKENEPENFSRISKIMLPKDYLAYRLCGAFCTDYSDASGTLLLDVKNRKWSEEMCGICGISLNQLPELFESYAPVGTVKEEIANLVGGGKITVCAGAGDNAAAAIGTGTVKDGDCNISLGTSGTVFISKDEFSVDKRNALHSFDHANGKYHLMGCILSAASANKWWIEDITGSSYDLPEKAEEKIGKNDVMFLPYLSGERSPHNDVNARACFIGMNPATTKEEMSLAVLEGVAFAIRDCVEVAAESGLKITETNLCGGGAKSKLWRRIIADVLNVRVNMVETEQGPSFGAAILAMVGCGEYPSVQKAAEAIIHSRTVAVPDKEAVALYDAKYARFKKLYPALKNLFI